MALKLVVITGFYRYCVEEQLLEHSPAVHVRRPRRRWTRLPAVPRFVELVPLRPVAGG